jgi:3-oxoacyl-[acyl-carrier protein] reductase
MVGVPSQAPSNPPVAVISGGAGGIGLAVAQRLGRDGYTIVLLDHNPHALADALKQLADEKVTAGAVWMEIRQKTEVHRAFTQVVRVHGRIDALVCLAGGTLYTHPVQEFPLVEWQEVVDVNLKGTFLCCQAVIPTMRRQGHGAIVNTASNYGITGGATRTAYAASKAAIIAFTKSLALELAPDGIRANVIAPGRTATARVMGHYSTEEWASKTQDIPMGRAANPDETADGIAFLLSDDSAYMTGQTLHVNGGMVLP